MNAGQVNITILADDRAGAGLTAQHGFSLWVEVSGQNILFDTGPGNAIEYNAVKLGVDLSQTDAITLSHGHYDHTGGLAEALLYAPNAKVYSHPSAVWDRYSIRKGVAKQTGMPAGSRRAIKSLPYDHLHWTEKSIEIFPGIGLTGTIPRMTGYEDAGGPFFLDPKAKVPDTIPDDMALWIDTPKGLVILTGCAHAGLANTINFAKIVSGAEKINAIIGGFHLSGADDRRLRLTSEALLSFNPSLVVPCHCTGEKASSLLSASLGNIVKPGWAGLRLAL